MLSSSYVKRRNSKFLACDLGHSKNKTGNHMDMQFIFWPQKSHSSFMCMCLQIAGLCKAHGGTPPCERPQHWVWAGLPLRSVTHEWLLFRAWTADFVQSQTIYLLQTYGVSIIWCEFSGKMNIWDMETYIIWEHWPVWKFLFMAAWLLSRENFSFSQLIC